jgi:hypothetical protein
MMVEADSPAPDELANPVSRSMARDQDEALTSIEG